MSTRGTAVIALRRSPHNIEKGVGHKPFPWREVLPLSFCPVSRRVARAMWVESGNE